MWLQLDELLQPLPGASRGENLRYAPIYDKIKEARIEDEDDLPQGEWQRERKYADIPTVLKLATAAITKQSKDLQLAVWLCEALIRREGFAAVPECLQLLYQLQEHFWDILYPELDEGSPEFRATPLEWFAGRCDYLLRRTSLTQNKLNWLKYKESRAVGYESAAAEDKEKMARREAAIADNKVTAEQFDEGFKATPKTFYVESCSHLESAQEAAQILEAFCEQKYGNVAPNLARLRSVLQDLKAALDTLLKKKRELEPDEVPQAATPAQAESEAGARSGVDSSSDAGAQPAAKVVEVVLQSSISPEAGPEEVFAVIGRMAEHLRKSDPSSAVPYLLARAVRWGELRSSGDDPDPALLLAPSSELRQRLKSLHAKEEWAELQSAAEAATISPCGRAWLDLQRYSWQACNQLSQSAPARAICSEVRSLIADFPSLPKWKLTDDTPVAGDATCEWLQQHVLPPPPEEPEPVLAVALPSAASNNGSAEQFEAAAQLARSGRMGEAVDLLSSQASHENAGREKFLLQLKIAQLCLNHGYHAIAHPILQSLYDEIQRRDLIGWEGANFVVQLLTLLVQSIDKTSQDTQQRSQVYNLLCRLEPSVALQLQK